MNDKESQKVARLHLPRHTALIMDGNGRWARARALPRTAGHKKGVERLEQILKAACELHLETLTVYAFSTENWRRPHSEVDFLMNLFSSYLTEQREALRAHQVRLRFLGRRDNLSPKLQQQMSEAEATLANETGLTFNIAVNYGGQDELVRATQRLATRVATGTLAPQEIHAALIESVLDTAGLPPVDLLIRTSGDMRLSNFLLWQTAYAEFWFTQTLWPDFTPNEFRQALKDFAQRPRRFGGLDASTDRSS